MKIRIKFQKYGVMRFIGHLDMMRYFQKAMRRAEIDIAYTEGFSPHQIMSFAAPLGVGITSEGEYLDIQVNSTKSSIESLQALNQVMVEGVSVSEYKKLPEGAKNAMSSVEAADYLVTFKEPEKNPFTFEKLSVALKTFYENQTEIFITKKTKKSEKVMDLKPLIYQLEARGEENPGFFLKISTGSNDNIKPELVLEAFSNYLKTASSELSEISFAFEPLKMQIHRIEVYGKEDGSFVTLGDFGEEIC